MSKKKRRKGPPISPRNQGTAPTPAVPSEVSASITPQEKGLESTCPPDSSSSFSIAFLFAILPMLGIALTFLTKILYDQNRATGYSLCAAAMLLCGLLAGAHSMSKDLKTKRKGSRTVWGIALFLWLVCSVTAWTFRPKPQFELIPEAQVSRIVAALKDPSGRNRTSAVLVYAVEPDKSAAALAEQLKEIFHRGEWVVVEGSKPDNISEIPGVSCVMFGRSVANASLFRGLLLVMEATKGDTNILMSPIYSGRYNSTAIGRSKTKEEIWKWSDLMAVDHSWTNSVAVVMIRKR